MGAEMSHEYKETNGTRIDALNIENLMNDHEHVLPSRRTVFKERNIEHGRWMKRRLAIDCQDHTSFDRNGAIMSHPFDQRWNVRICPIF